MKIVVIGGTGLVGSQVVARLGEHGHEAVAASPDTGVNTLTGQGLPEVLAGADVVVDVSNSPSLADEDVLDFFRTSTQPSWPLSALPVRNTTSSCRSSVRTGCSAAATCAPRLRRKRLSRLGESRG